MVEKTIFSMRIQILSMKFSKSKVQSANSNKKNDLFNEKTKRRNEYYLLKALDSLANTTADFRQLFGPENKHRYPHNYGDLRYSKPEKAVARQAPSLGPIHGKPDPGPIPGTVTEENRAGGRERSEL